MQEKEVPPGWYALTMYAAYGSMKEAIKVRKSNKYPQRFIEEFKQAMQELDSRPYGAAVFGLDEEHLLVIDKLSTGAVIGLTTKMGLRASSPGEAYSKAVEEGFPAGGALVVRYMRMGQACDAGPRLH